MRVRACVAVLLLVLLPAATAGCAPMAADPATLQQATIYGAERHFKLDWAPGERRGRPVVSGHVLNDWGFLTWNMLLRVDSLDAAGAVTRTTLGYVPGRVGPGMSVYFEIPVPDRAPSYRVSIVTFDYTTGGDGSDIRP